MLNNCGTCSPALDAIYVPKKHSSESTYFPWLVDYLYLTHCTSVWTGLETAQAMVNNLINGNIFPFEVSSSRMMCDIWGYFIYTIRNIPVSIRRTTLAHMLNEYEICINTTNYPIVNMQDFSSSLPILLSWYPHNESGSMNLDIYTALSRILTAVLYWHMTSCGKSCKIVNCPDQSVFNIVRCWQIDQLSWLSALKCALPHPNVYVFWILTSLKM